MSREKKLNKAINQNVRAISKVTDIMSGALCAPWCQFYVAPAGHLQTSHLLGSVRPWSALVPAKQGCIFFAYGGKFWCWRFCVKNGFYILPEIWKSLQNMHPWSGEVSCILKCIAKTRARALISVHRPSLAARTARAPSEFLWKYRRVTSKLSSIVPA